MSVFEELFSVRFLLSCTVCFGVYMLTPAFITLWIGPEYVLDNLTLGLMVVTLYISLARSTVDAYTTPTIVQRYLGSGGRGVDQYRDVGVVGLVFRPARNSCGRIAEPADRGILLEALFPVPEGAQRETADICEHVCETWIARIGGVGRHVFDSWTFAVRSDCGNRFLADLRSRRNRNILFVAFCGPLYCD